MGSGHSTGQQVKRTTALPVPPLKLIDRIGKSADFPTDVLAANPWLQDPVQAYEGLGADIRDYIVAALPEDWSFSGKRVLDFGCGSGRVLRHFIAQEDSAEFWGADIDRPSIEWLQAHLSPPLRVLVSGENPPLDLPSQHFDLVYAISVFTHLTDSWSPWLLELRRILKPDGLLLATFHGPGVTHALARLGWHEAYDEERVGIHTLGHGTPWDDGGPSVIHSRWWLRAHWGRAFDIVSLTPGAHGSHGIFVGRKTEGEPTPAELERLEADDPRELAALNYSLRQAHAEVEAVRIGSTAMETQVEQCRRELGIVYGSRSWRLTQPLRALRRVLAR